MGQCYCFDLEINIPRPQEKSVQVEENNFQIMNRKLFWWTVLDSQEKCSSFETKMVQVQKGKNVLAHQENGVK